MDDRWSEDFRTWGVLGRRTSLPNRLLPSLWLGFLLLPLLAMWGRRGDTLPHDVIVTVVVAAFAGLFLYASATPDQVRQHWSRGHDVIVASFHVAVPLALVFADSGYWAYTFVYALLPAMRLWPQPIRYRLVLGMGALTGVAALASGLAVSDVIAPVSVVLGSGGGWLGFGRLIEANLALERAQEEKARVAVAEERLRFARDLHDLLGHSLSVITLKSELAGRLLAVDAGRAGTEMAEIELVARRALKEVREAVSGYHQATLAVELAGARKALASAHISWAEDVDTDLALPESVEAVLAWTVREGVTNVVRHSGAATCTLTLDVDDTTADATMSIVDDGTGGDGTGGGNGLRGLGERVAAVAGTVTAGPGPDGGYRLAVTVPVPATEVKDGDLVVEGPIGRMLAAARGRSAE
ncbi:MAG: histidine kinase [Actinomycetota bacterium]|nr:histidine kinase [Actinomycetota bacterium]